MTGLPNPIVGTTVYEAAPVTAWMTDNKLLRRTPDAGGAFTNELLPGSGL
jgi:hypothetical protein